MNPGMTLFAQLMACMPWTSFKRIVDRHGGEVRTHTFPCGEQFRAMAFAQLTWRESLRDVEACLAANPAKLYGMGFRQSVKRSTLADANERRDWRIWAEVAELLIRRARKLYCDDGFGLDLDSTVYALDSTTIDLCLSLFDWAPFRSTKAAIKLHTLLDLRGSIPSFIHISDGKMHDVRVLDILPIEPGAFYVMDRGYLDFERLYGLGQQGAFYVTRAKHNMGTPRACSMPSDREQGIICDQSIAPNSFYAFQHYPAQLRMLMRPRCLVSISFTTCGLLHLRNNHSRSRGLKIKHQRWGKRIVNAFAQDCTSAHWISLQSVIRWSIHSTHLAGPPLLSGTEFDRMNIDHSANLRCGYLHSPSLQYLSGTLPRMHTPTIRTRILLGGAVLLVLGGCFAWWRISRQVRQAFNAPTRNIQALQFAPLPLPTMPVEHWGGGEVSGLGLSAEGLVTAGAFGVFDGSGDISAGLPTLNVSALTLWRGRPVAGLTAGGLFLRRDKAWEEARTGFGTLHVRDLRETPGGELLIGAREGFFRAAWGANVLERLDGTPVRSLAASSGGLFFAGGEQGLMRFGSGLATVVPTPDPWVDGVAMLDKELLVLTPKGLARGPVEGPLLPVSGAEEASAFTVLGTQIFAVSEGRLLRFETSGRPSEEMLSSKVIKVFVSEKLLFADTETGLFRRGSSGWTLARPRPASLPIGPCHVNALAMQDGRLIVGLFNGGLATGTPTGNSLTWKAVPGSVAWGVNSLLNAGGTLYVASLRGVARLEGGKLKSVEPLDAGAAFSLASTREGVAMGFGQGVLLPGSRLLSAFHGLPGNQALALIQGPGESDLLFVGTPSGLGAISMGRVAWRTTPGDGKLPHPWVTALAYHGEDLYIGTFGGGVVRRIASRSGSAGPGVFEPFPETADLKVNTGCLVEVAERLFLGTDGRGLWRLGADGSHFTLLKVPLPSLHITAILPGKDALYIGTDEGLVRLPLLLPEDSY